MKKRLFILTQILLYFFVTIAETYAQWEQTNGPEGLYVYDFAVSGTNIFAGAEDSNNPQLCCRGLVLLSTDNGANWTSVSTGIVTKQVSALAISDTNIFAGTFGGGSMYLSTNNGTSWTEINTGMADADTIVSTLAISGTNIFAGTVGGGVYLSTDAGANWTAVNTGLTDLRVVSSLATSGTNIFAGTSGGVFFSTDSGANWTETGLTEWIGPIAVSGSNIFAGVSAGILRSTDNGENWTDVTEGLPNNWVFDIAFSDTNVFVLTNWGGISLSTDNGANWTLINEGIIDSLILSIAVNDSFIFAGSGLEGGVWRRPLSQIITVTSVEDASGSLSSNFNLAQNYPNPFNPETVIRYSIPKAEKVSIVVYNLLGEKVARLIDERIQAGVHTVSWDASNMASGIYFYRLQAGDFVQTRKMVLLK